MTTVMNIGPIGTSTYVAQAMCDDELVARLLPSDLAIIYAACEEENTVLVKVSEGDCDETGMPALLIERVL